MGSVLLFFSVMLLTFLSGFQNKNIAGNHYILAFFTSFLLGVVGLLLYKVMPTASNAEMIAYVLAGPIGIIFSMLVHNRFVGQSASNNACTNCSRNQKKISSTPR